MIQGEQIQNTTQFGEELLLRIQPSPNPTHEYNSDRNLMTTF